MKSKDLRIGVLGTANIAERYIIPAILNSRLNLVGIASRNIGKAELLASKFEIKAFDGYETLIDSKIIDAIYIPLPNALHYIWVKYALDKGIHVLVEKSLGCSFKEVKVLNEIAINRRLVLIENFQFRFHDQLKIIKGILGRKELGDLRSFSATFGFPPFKDETNIRYQKHLGGGALLDAGAYTTKISQILFGEGLEVKASSLNKFDTNGVDIWGSALLREKKTGLSLHLSFGFDNYYQCGISIWGSKGKLTTNRLFTAPPNYEPIINVEKINEMQVIKTEPDNHFDNMLEHFYDLCLGNKDLEQEYSQNLDQSRLLEEIKLLSNG